jgi:hypothetical protein
MMGVRANEKRGVEPLNGWSVRGLAGCVLLAGLIMLGLPLFLLSQSAYAKGKGREAAGSGHRAAAPAARERATGKQTAEPAPLLDPDGASPAEPVVTPDAPAPDDAKPLPASSEPVEPAAPDPPKPAAPEPSPADSPDPAPAHETASSAEQPVETTVPVEGTTDVAPEAITPTPKIPSPPVQVESHIPAPANAAERALGVTPVGAVALRGPNSLERRSFTAWATGPVVSSLQLRGSNPEARRATRTAATTNGDSSRLAPLNAPAPPVPRTPSGSVCGGSGSCGTAYPLMLPLLMLAGCLCALLLERLVQAFTFWRPERVLSPLERPG